ncbi:uncharacterized protein LOC129921134 [Episyrphus balteatus]|uniref:uncharacterized protein LOC129921134 n=1 Tax=Episyrphus balteatus TaxID=286459 RepID=UPI002485DA18|nr:uncharacterized protein LOC129921134 [Episyrphus balteatus]XP_055858798.1 uncharacterized protein LOC129921134 [Episyrphus balteatus]
MKTMFWIIKLPIVGIAMGFITFIISFLNLVEIIDHFNKQKHRLPGFIFFTANENILKWEIAIYSMFLISGLFLIIGTIKKIHQIFLPWLILTAFGILYGVVCTIFQLFLAMGSVYFFGNNLWIGAIGLIFLISFCIYVWIGIVQLYSNIYEEKESETEVDPEKL